MTSSRFIHVGLIAALLIAGVPAWKHAHPGGDRPHGHDHKHEHEHEAAGEPHCHLHVVLFGVEFTLPADPDDDESEEGRPTYLVAAPATVSLAQASLPAVACAMSLDAPQPVRIVLSFHPKTASATPLCDTARHERSGVLLA
jgi:hypothetical protein